MMSGASAQPCTTTDAACAMIATAWHGDPVVFIGDYWGSFPPRDESGRRIAALFEGYDNIEGLLRATMEDITEKVSLLMDQSLSADFLEDPMPVLSRIGDYLGSDRALHEKIVSSTSVEPFINSLHEMFRKKIRERLRQDTSHPATKVDLVTIEYLASGVLGTYRSWLSGDFGDVPVESIDDYLCSLVRATGRVSFGRAGSQSAIAARRARA